MSSLRDAREIAPSLRDALQADHFGNPSFRIYGRIFATVPDLGHLNVMIDPIDVQAAVSLAPAACAELWFGQGTARCEGRAATCFAPVAWRSSGSRLAATGAEAATGSP